MAYEYKWTEERILNTPLDQALLYHEAIYARREIDTGKPSPAELDILKSFPFQT